MAFFPIFPTQYSLILIITFNSLKSHQLKVFLHKLKQQKVGKIVYTDLKE